MRNILQRTIVLTVLLITACDARAQIWTTETVAPNAEYVDFAIDGAGTLHVLYIDGEALSGPELNYAFDSGTGWQYQTVPEGPEPSRIGIAVDDAFVPHIAFIDSTSMVQYGYLSEGAWTLEPLPTLPVQSHPYDPSIVLDASGAPHIAFQTYGEKIRYAHKVGGAWTDEQVDESVIGLNNSRVGLAIDPSGKLHIAARQTFGGPALYTLEGSTWSHENIGVGGYQPWVVYDPDGFAHFLYHGDGVSYATNQTGNWVTDVIDSNTTPEENDIALDQNGIPAITFSLTVGLYYEPPDFHWETRFYFAYLVGGVWQREQVDIAPDYTGAPYMRSCVAFDADNVPHVVYRDAGSGELRHAVRELSTAVESPRSSRLIGPVSVLPNPFNPATRISFRLATATTTRITIHDAKGRRVRTLFDGLLTAGEQSKRWNGRDESGRAVASGVYFVRIAAATEDALGKLVLVR